MRTDVRILGPLALLVLPGCAFSDGDPWGEARFAVEVVLDDAGRASEDGYRTSNDYLVEVEAFELDLGAVSLRMGGADAAHSFDPASPPAGYSLCHNGHCHADDGRLVPYEDIALEVAGTATAAATIVQAIEASVEVGPTPTAAPLGVCTDECRLPRARLATVSTSVTAARVSLRISDRLPEGRRRLPPEGATFGLEVPLETLTIATPVYGRIDGRRPPVVEVGVVLSVPATLFDGVDWAGDPEPAATLAAALDQHLDLDARVTRSDF